MTRQSQASIEKTMGQSAIAFLLAGHLPFLLPYPDCGMHYVMFRNRYDNINWQRGYDGFNGEWRYHKDAYLAPDWNHGLLTNVGRMVAEGRRVTTTGLRAHPFLGSLPIKDAASQWAAWMHGNPRAYAQAIQQLHKGLIP